MLFERLAVTEVVCNHPSRAIQHKRGGMDQVGHIETGFHGVGPLGEYETFLTNHVGKSGEVPSLHVAVNRLRPNDDEPA